MSDHPGDLADEVADKLQREMAEEVVRGNLDLVDERAQAQADARRKVFAKIEFSWRPADRAILEQIRTGARACFAEMFDETLRAVDELYASVRVPETQVVGGHEVVKRTQDGRVVYKRDPRGAFAEDWSSLTGQDIDGFLFRLQHVKLLVSQQVNELLAEAVFARHIASDAYDDGWMSLLEGTQGDRAARANRESRQDRYFAFFKWVLWSQADTFMRELVWFMRTVEAVRDRRIREQRG